MAKVLRRLTSWRMASTDMVLGTQVIEKRWAWRKWFCVLQDKEGVLEQMGILTCRASFFGAKASPKGGGRHPKSGCGSQRVIVVLGGDGLKYKATEERCNPGAIRHSQSQAM